MFYISSLKDNLIGVTDTRDGIEEFYKDKDIFKLLESGIEIYGTNKFNYKSNSNPIEIDIEIKKSKLIDLLDKWKKVHNNWTGRDVANYLASVKVGTEITVQYITKGTKGVNRGKTVIKKLNYDEWIYEDTVNVASGRTGNHDFAAWNLEVACIYSTPVSISIN